jgi:putative sigma-54 modulation protein
MILSETRKEVNGMRVSYAYGDVHRTPALQEHIQNKVEKVERLVTNTSEDMVHLQIKMDKVHRKEEYRVHLNMHFPGRTLHAEDTSHNAMTSSTEAFEDLLRQIKTYKQKMRSRRRDGAKAVPVLSDQEEAEE